MNKEFKNLYLEHCKATWFLSVIPSDCPTWNALVEWSKNNKEDAVDGIIEILKQEPSNIVGLCDILFPDILKSKGFIPLDSWCNMWLNILIAYKEKKEFNPLNITDYYKDYNKWMEYLKTNYISWNPFKESDPNVTLEEFRQGKRNKKRK